MTPGTLARSDSVHQKQPPAKVAFAVWAGAETANSRTARNINRFTMGRNRALLRCLPDSDLVHDVAHAAHVPGEIFGAALLAARADAAAEHDVAALDLTSTSLASTKSSSVSRSQTSSNSRASEGQ